MSSTFKILQGAFHLLQKSNITTKQLTRTTIVRYKSNKRKIPTNDLSLTEVLMTPEEIEARDKTRMRIRVLGQPNIGVLTGTPEEVFRNRRVRIFKPPKNVMQSGTANLHEWQIEFDARERWENPLMGWSSTGDPLSNLQMNFTSEQEAIAFCEKHGLRWSVDEPAKAKKFRRKNYGINFAYNKRTRVSTK